LENRRSGVSLSFGNQSVIVERPELQKSQFSKLDFGELSETVLNRIAPEITKLAKVCDEMRGVINSQGKMIEWLKKMAEGEPGDVPPPPPTVIMQISSGPELHIALDEGMMMIEGSQKERQQSDERMGKLEKDVEWVKLNLMKMGGAQRSFVVKQTKGYSMTGGTKEPSEISAPHIPKLLTAQVLAKTDDTTSEPTSPEFAQKQTKKTSPGKPPKLTTQSSKSTKKTSPGTSPKSATESPKSANESSKSVKKPSPGTSPKAETESPKSANESSKSATQSSKSANESSKSATQSSKSAKKSPKLGKNEESKVQFPRILRNLLRNLWSDQILISQLEMLRK
jgi:hypothetical protein